MLGSVPISEFMGIITLAASIVVSGKSGVCPSVCLSVCLVFFVTLMEIHSNSTADVMHH